MMYFMETLLQTAITAAKEAGDAIMALYASTEFETKADGSPVTVADMTANEIVLTHLRTTHIPILTEESDGITVPYPEQLWIIDPIDGTTGFIKKNGEFAVMIGLLEHGHSILGVVYEPAHNALYYARRGEGAYCEKDGIKKALSVQSIAPAPLRFVRTRNHATPFMDIVAEKLHTTSILCGGIGIKTNIIARGDGDFFFTLAELGDWDVCAPSIIVTEAGGTVTDCIGNPLTYGTKNHRLERGVIFSNTVCHHDVVTAIHTSLPIQEAHQ